MSFSNNPQFSTYKQEQITFDGTPLFRSGDLTVNRDLQIVNMYYDRVSQENKTRETRLRKRPGLAATTYSLTKAASTDSLRGSFYDPDQNTFYWAVNNKVYSVSPDVGISVRTVTTLSTSSGYVGFCSFLKSDDTRYVIITDGIDLWVDNYAAVTCTQVVDADMPTPHQPYPVYLNGYIFLIEANSGNIWNSDNDDPTAWTAGSFIQAEINSDYALRLIKAKNYLVCLGRNSAEYFWDAGNATNSPLSRNDSPVRSVGYLTGLCTIADTTYFVGQDEKSNVMVYAINSFKIEPISNSVVNRTLEAFSSTQNSKSNVTLGTDGYAISVDGHTFYVLVTPQTTWVYDVTDKFWYEWKGSSGTGLKIEGVWGMTGGGTYVAIQNQTYVSILAPSVYQDFGVSFTCRYTTEPNNHGTMNWKTLNRLGIQCSRYQTTGSSLVYVSWSDTDWATSATQRSINIFSISPYITRGGKYRVRSYRIEYTDNYPFWGTGLELNLNIGQI